MKSKLTIVVGVLAAVATIMYVYASNQHRPAPKNMVATMAGFRDRMCACKDAPCRDAVGVELSTFIQSLSGASPEADDITRFNAVSNEMTACMTGSAGAAPAAGAKTPPEAEHSTPK
jgi:hypothetical protein